jgi:hypothetical protein
MTRKSNRNLMAVMRVGVVVAALSGALVASTGVASAHGHARHDRDGDGLTNRFERTMSHTSPRVADPDHDGLSDGRENLDYDGLTNLREQRLGTDPRSADTDEDGRDDDDCDGVSNETEAHDGTDPEDSSDHDGGDGSDDDACVATPPAP